LKEQASASNRSDCTFPENFTMRLLLFPVSLLVTLFFSRVSAIRQGRPQQEHNGFALATVQQRKLNSAQYTIPTFALTFRSPNILQGDVREDLALLGSTLKGPLKNAVTEFVFESFREGIARLGQDISIPQMIRLLRYVNFDVTVVHSERNKEEDHSLRRDLQLGWFEFYAQFKGSAYFNEPVDPSTKPDDEYMEKLLGSWLEQYFVEDFSDLRQMLRSSEEPILQNLDYLVVLTDVIPDVFPYDEETPGLGAKAPNSSDANSSSDAAGKLMIIVLVVVGTATLGAMLLLVRPMVAKNRVHPQEGAFPRLGDESLPGRGGEEITVDTENMEESDLWLQQHRPELFRALQRSNSVRAMESSESSGNDGIMNTSPNSKSNPLQFLYGGLFVRRNKDEQLPSVSLASRDSQSIEAQEMVQEASQTWWQKLASSLQGHTLACDEDPSTYEFAFSDFPRHDGTPCLIFSETETGPVLRRVSVKDSPAAQPLSNDAFKRQLSMHDVSGNGELDDTDDTDIADVEFTTKLERLVAMRHRHYEKERLVQKARQERRKAEARERELKLRRHEMELDVEEIEASLTPRAVVRKNFNAENNFAEPARRVSHHRVTLSDSNYFAAVDEAMTKPDSKPQRGAIELGTINGGPSLRHDSEDLPPPPRYSGSHSRNLSDHSPRKLAEFSHIRNLSETSPEKLVVSQQPHPLLAQPKRRLAHRRSFSHGTQETEEKKIEHTGHQRNDSSAEDVMTFGIAAYAGFV